MYLEPKAVSAGALYHQIHQGTSHRGTAHITRTRQPGPAPSNLIFRPCCWSFIFMGRCCLSYAFGQLEQRFPFFLYFSQQHFFFFFFFFPISDLLLLLQKQNVHGEKQISPDNITRFSLSFQSHSTFPDKPGRQNPCWRRSKPEPCTPPFSQFAWKKGYTF